MVDGSRATLPPMAAMENKSVMTTRGRAARRVRGIRPRLNFKRSNEIGNKVMTESQVIANLTVECSISCLSPYLDHVHFRNDL